MTKTLSIYTSIAFTLIVAWVHYFLSSKVASQFEDVFDGFGAELPWLTNLMLPDAPYYWLAPIIIVLLHIAHHSGYLSRPMVLLASSVGTVASIVLCLIGLYLPIFQLGAVVA